MARILRADILDSYRTSVDNRGVRGASLMLILAGLSACKRQPASDRSCDQVGARFVTIARDQLAQRGPGMDPELRTGVDGLIAPMRDSMVRACREDRWSTTARTCFADAPDQEAFRRCEASLSGEQRESLQQSAARGVQSK